MKHLRRLALAADAVALMTLMLGSWTRINGAGLTCPDWPLCRGHLLPSLADGTIWEWLHRLLAFAVAPFVIALIVVAWRQRRSSPFVAPTMAAIALLFLVQVFLGAETVRLANTPISVVAHWATAMALIAALSAMAVFAMATDRAEPSQRLVGIVRAADCNRIDGRRSLCHDVHRRVRQLERRGTCLPVNTAMRRQRGGLHAGSVRADAASHRCGQ